jgi:hypothetical protein
VLNQTPYFDAGISGYQANGTTTLYWDRYRLQHKSGIGALRMTAVGATTGGCIATTAASAVVTAATDYQISGWLMSNVALTDARLAVDWMQSGGTFISTSLPTQIALSSFVWTFFSAVVTAPALAGLAKVRARAVLADTNILWVDDLRLMPVSSYSTAPQILVVDQQPLNDGVTGLVIPSGEPIEVVQPWRMGF